MAVTSTPIFAQTPYVKTLTLAAQTACTTRGPTATASLAGANITAFVPVSTNGLRIDSIQVNGVSTAIGQASVANVVGIWIWDGTTAYLWTEILTTVVTPSATAVAYTGTYTPTLPLNLPAAFALYASVTVTTTAAGSALQVTAFGGAY
ncbi:hypothetical protein UFOVP842_52 [uncultured Caudovirales phage]|uniref:Uncharacterized protein n=1 Tax=uncultured Caudovirales phage TaxID=2100421 RepID=A0A6J5MYM6_9CAUD|nr:hypothetical protein UFOVP305_3 [uncultured Caudovirales phage]CAB4151974.1 hypothetical protein UFOVP593_42 [uncultured Caudovirales phage]CAB4166787.1 hypothetical protein UFOVP842_52 [uncultured Caudovirales phage]